VKDQRVVVAVRIAAARTVENHDRAKGYLAVTAG